MSYPAGVATGNAVIAAALEWEACRTLRSDCSYERHRRSVLDLQRATRAHRAATALEHTQGPDIDADGGLP